MSVIILRNSGRANYPFNTTSSFTIEKLKYKYTI